MGRHRDCRRHALPDSIAAIAQSVCFCPTSTTRIFPAAARSKLPFAAVHAACFLSKPESFIAAALTTLVPLARLDSFSNKGEICQRC